MRQHEEIFREYVAEMREGMALAVSWWQQVLEGERSRVGGEIDVERIARRRWPFGPASHPYIIGIYRKYFLKCEALNKTLKENRPPESSSQLSDDEVSGWGLEMSKPEYGNDDDPIPGWVLLVDSLRGSHNDVAKFIGGLVFKPIGIDRDTGEYV